MWALTEGYACGTTQPAQPAITRAIVTYGREVDQRPEELLPRVLRGVGEVRPSRLRGRLDGSGGDGPLTRGSFGALRRRRLPQYGHSVM